MGPMARDAMAQQGMAAADIDDKDHARWRCRYLQCRV